MLQLHTVFPDEPEGDFLVFYAQLSAYATPIAFLVSYSRHRDVKWALLHAFLGVPYLVYVGKDVLLPSRDPSWQP